MPALPFDLLVITDAIACQRAGRSVLDTIQQMFAAQEWPRVAVLLREKQAPLPEVEQLLQSLRPVVASAKAHLLVHSYPQLALDYGLGIHLAAPTTLPPIRSFLGTQVLLGASRHEFDDLGTADLAVADYVTMSPVFVPTSKPMDTRTPLGLEGLRKIIQRSSKPLVALGGIHPAQVAPVMAQGAAGIAVSGAILQAENPAYVLQQFVAALQRASTVHP
jgi:thiamine-phosphate pyrophosphorylase